MPNFEAFLESAYDIVDTQNLFDTVVIMRVDICRFKEVNDNYGHEVGDKVIVVFYDTLADSVRAYSDRSAIARGSGDEFLAYFEGDWEQA